MLESIRLEVYFGKACKGTKPVFMGVLPETKEASQKPLKGEAKSLHTKYSCISTCFTKRDLMACSDWAPRHIVSFLQCGISKLMELHSLRSSSSIALAVS